MRRLTPTVDCHLSGGALESMAADVRHGLALPLKEIPPKYFYDARGSDLFDEITRLAEYYPTRCERELLQSHAGEIASLTGARELVELGSGTASKTLVLLDAMQAGGRLRGYVPFDCSEEVVRECVDRLAERYPGLSLHGVVGDFDAHLELIPSGRQRLTAFLGGTIGNLYPLERSMFLERLAGLSARGDWLLVGTDLVKERAVLERAYNDSAGVTAEFNLNVLHVLNRELGADFDVDAFEHVAFFDSDNDWMDLRLRSLAAQSVSIPGAGIRMELAKGEEIRTEISAKFTPERVARELAGAGFQPVRFYSDGMFGLSLARRA